MKCPQCNEVLLMTMRENVEIDYCPKCRGIWLDKGELDKLLNAIATEMPQQQYRPEHNGQRQQYGAQNQQPPQQHYVDEYDQNNPHRKKSTVERIFDIFD
jgi:hypothetical protein